MKILILININFPPSIKDVEQCEKDNTDISVTIFEYGGFYKIKEDDVKEGIVIRDVRVSPYALKRKHLVELLIIKKKLKTKILTKLLKKRILQQ